MDILEHEMVFFLFLPCPVKCRMWGDFENSMPCDMQEEERF